MTIREKIIKSMFPFIQFDDRILIAQEIKFEKEFDQTDSNLREIAPIKLCIHIELLKYYQN